MGAIYCVATFAFDAVFVMLAGLFVIKETLIKSKYGSIHFPFVLSAAFSAAYRRNERKTLTTNGLNQRFLKAKFTLLRFRGAFKFG